MEINILIDFLQTKREKQEEASPLSEEKTEPNHREIVVIGLNKTFAL